MKNIFILTIVLLLNKSDFFSQGIFTVSTNKISYSYGEVIEVEVSIFNDTDTTIIFHPECEWPIWVSVKGVEFIERHSLADGCERYLVKGERETWTFKLDPAKLGFPIKNEIQTIHGSGYSHLDSVTITAPKFYGGIIEVNYDYILDTEKKKKINFYNGLNKSVIKYDTIKDNQRINELWSIQNRSIDSIVYEEKISQNSFGNVNSYRLFEQGIKTVTSVNEIQSIPNNYALFNNYPNPFNPSTTIIYQIPKQSMVKIRVCDILGQEVATIINEEQSAGEHSITFDGSTLSSGIYFYQLIAGNIILTKKFMLMK